MNHYAHNNHAAWLERSYGVKCSPLGSEVANVLGYIGNGLYNAPVKLARVDWAESRCIKINWYTGHGLANFDFDELTKLVLECHLRLMRVEIKASNCQYIGLFFSQRKTREGSDWDRMPSIEEMIERNSADWEGKR